jgi:HlyD family secretion protein
LMIKPDAAIRQYVLIGLAAVFMFGGTATAWSLIARIDSAVVTQGTVVVESNIKKVQHPTGGVIGAIFVKEGDHVNEGEVVVRLDETATKSALDIVVNDLTSTRARAARLVAERDGEDHVKFPDDLFVKVDSDPLVKDVIEGEMKVFASRLTMRRGLKAQLNERIGQTNEEIKGLKDQQKSIEIQLRVTRRELDGLRGLESRGLVPKPRIAALEKEVAGSDGQLGETTGRLMSARGRIAETQLQVLQLDNDHMTEVNKDLREAETRINELQDRKVTAEDQLRRIEIRSPISGMVHQLTVHTIGGVVGQTEPLMLIVPDTDKLIVQVKIQPQDIDQVHVGQLARVRFTAFNQRTTPEVMGKLFRIAADLTTEPQSGQSYFSAAVSLTEEEVAKLGKLKLLPGMPADAFITTGNRTFASYLIKPLTDQMNRSMRER